MLQGVPLHLMWTLSVTGAVLALIGVVLLGARRLHTALFLEHIGKNCRSGDWERARKIALAMSETSVGRVVRHALDLRLEAVVLETDEVAGYRDAPAEVPLADRVRRALEPTAAAERRQLRPRRVMSLIGGLAAAASLVRPVALDWPMAIAVLGLLLAMLAAHWHRRLTKDLDETVETMISLVRPGDEMYGPPPERDRSPPGDQRLGHALELRIVEPDGTERVEAHDRDLVKLGRIPTAHVFLDHPDVCRLHAVIEVGPDGTRLIDLGTDGRTIVNGHPADKVQLTIGDEIHIGPYRIFVTNVGQPAP